MTIESITTRLARNLKTRVRRPNAWSAKAFEYGVRRRREIACRRWVAQINRSHAGIFLGPNFDAHGGVRHHIHAIANYSSEKVAMVPDDAVLQILNADDGVEGFKKIFEVARYPYLRALHSHVDPWFIGWCNERRRSGVRWIHTYHLNYFPEHAKGGLLPWHKEINHALLNVACHAHVRISVARWQQEDLLKTHQIETIYLPNGVDVALCDRADANRFRREIGGGPFLLYVGRNAPVKNPADFVRLAQRLPDRNFVMIGHGLSLEALHDEWSLEVPANLLVHGPASHLETLDAIAACSVLVVTSKREGLPTLVLEAMTQCKPVVVPEEAGCMEAVGDGQFGFTYRDGNIEDLAEKTMAASADKQRGPRARKRVLAEYDWRVIASKLDAIYRGESPAANGTTAS